MLLAHLVRTAATEGVGAAGAQHVAFTQVAAAVARHTVPLRVGGRDGQGCDTAVLPRRRVLEDCLVVGGVVGSGGWWW